MPTERSCHNEYNVHVLYERSISSGAFHSGSEVMAKVKFLWTDEQTVCLSVYRSHKVSIFSLAMLLDMMENNGSKLPYEELQVKFDFQYGWPTFSRITALCSILVVQNFLCYAYILS